MEQWLNSREVVKNLHNVVGDDKGTAEITTAYSEVCMCKYSYSKL